MGSGRRRRRRRRGLRPEVPPFQLGPFTAWGTGSHAREHTPFTLTCGEARKARGAGTDEGGEGRTQASSL